MVSRSILIGPGIRPETQGGQSKPDGEPLATRFRALSGHKTPERAREARKQNQPNSLGIPPKWTATCCIRVIR